MRKMKPSIKIAVIGGTGKSGKYLVNQLLLQGFQIKILLRNPDKFQVNSPLVEIVEGNVANADAIHALLKGCNAVISTLGMGVPPSEPTIFSQSTTNVLNTMKHWGTKRYIVITGLNVDTPTDNKSPKTVYATNWMKENFPVSTPNKQLESEILSKSELDWTLVRLPLIELSDERKPVSVSAEDCVGDKVSAADLADFLIKQIDSEQFVRNTPFVFNR